MGSEEQKKPGICPDYKVSKTIILSNGDFIDPSKLGEFLRIRRARHQGADGKKMRLPKRNKVPWN
jgi:hypothetical protein